MFICCIIAEGRHQAVLYCPQPAYFIKTPPRLDVSLHYSVNSHILSAGIYYWLQMYMHVLCRATSDYSVTSLALLDTSVTFFRTFIVKKCCLAFILRFSGGSLQS